VNKRIPSFQVNKTAGVVKKCVQVYPHLQWYGCHVKLTDWHLVCMIKGATSAQQLQYRQSSTHRPYTRQFQSQEALLQFNNTLPIMQQHRPILQTCLTADGPPQVGPYGHLKVCAFTGFHTSAVCHMGHVGEASCLAMDVHLGRCTAKATFNC
jgi:hypothetical protein